MNELGQEIKEETYASGVKFGVKMKLIKAKLNRKF